MRMLTISFMLFILFLFSGIFWVSESIRFVAEVAWLFAVVMLVLTGIAVMVSVARRIWVKGATAGLVPPDENGNFPMHWNGKEWVNLNIKGAVENERSWGFWQATNHKSLGTPSRVLTEQPALPQGDTMQLPANIKRITRESTPPPIMLEAKKVGQAAFND